MPEMKIVGRVADIKFLRRISGDIRKRCRTKILIKGFSKEGLYGTNVFYLLPKIT